MSTARSLVTIVGSRRRVETAVPSNSPILEWLPAVVDLCGEDESGDRPTPVPSTWSVTRLGSKPLPLTSSLADAEILDGETLFLEDWEAYGEPRVADHDGELARALATPQRGVRPRWDRQAVGAFLAGGGAAVAIGATVAATGRRSADAAAAGALAILAFAGAFMLLRAGGTAALRTVLAGSGVVLAAVGAGLGVQFGAHPDASRLLAASVAGLAAAAMASRVADRWLTAAIVPVATACGFGSGVRILTGASLPQTASVVALIVLAATWWAPRWSTRAMQGTPAKLGNGPLEAGDTRKEIIEQQAGAARSALAGSMMGLSAAFATASIVVGLDRSGWALATCLLLSAAAMIGSRRFAFLSEGLPLALAGLAGSIAALVTWVHGSSGTAIPVAIAGALLMATAASTAVRRRPLPGGSRSLGDGLESALLLALGPVTLGLWGAFSWVLGSYHIH